MKFQKIIKMFLLLLPGMLFSEDSGDRAGFDFLSTEIGARPAAMGGAFSAMVGDLNGLSHNPASLIGVRDKETSITFIDHFLDFQVGFIGFNKNLNRAGQIGFGLSYINYGEFKSRDLLGQELGTFVPFDFIITSTYSDSLRKGLYYGISLKYMQSKIYQYSASAIVFRGGLIYRLPKSGWDLGLEIANIGGVLDPFVDVRDKLPISYRIGFSKILTHLPLKINFDFIRYHYEKSDLLLGLYWTIGGEFTISKNLRLRWGYNSKGSEQKVNVGPSRLAGVNLGFGIKIGKYWLDYGYSSYGVIGSMNYFTLATSL
jgi:hypothetical protein